MDYSYIVELFSIPNIYFKVHSYYEEYSKLINQWLIENTLDRDQLLRYALVHLLHYYRQCNYLGENFSTIVNSSDYHNNLKYIRKKEKLEEYNIKIKKYKSFNKYFGIQIKTTEEYRVIMNLEKIEKNLNGKILFKYVIFGVKKPKQF